MSCKGPKGHLRPCHLNRGSHGHVWICLACGKQLAGPKLPDSERNALTEFMKYLTTPQKGKTEETNVNQISVTVTGKDRVGLVKQLRAAADNLDGTPAEEAGMDDGDDVDTVVETARGQKKSKGKKAAAAAMDEDDEDSMGEDSDDADTESDDEDAMEASGDDDETDEDEDFTAPAPKAKGKKVTVKDVNAACKVRAKAGGKKGRVEVLKILRKFGSESISEIKPEKYPSLIKALAV